jgi:putative PIN family toxin of toxin-antitoxin system
VLRVVLDPGVLISALISGRGAPAELLRSWIDGSIEIVASELLLRELGAVLLRSKFRAYVSEEDASEYVAVLRKAATVVPDPEPEAGLTPDPGDDYLVALAREARADYLVSGDPHLTTLKNARPPIVTPRRLLDLLERRGGG